MLTGAALTWTYVATGFSLFMLANLIYAVWRGRNQVAKGKTWSRTSGEIVESKVDVPRTHRSDDDTDCAPSVRYRYSVDGKTYESDRIAFGGESDTTRMLAEQTVAKYPAGAKVDVLYNPKQPKNAVLQGNSGTLPAIWVLLVVFAGISLVLCAHSIAGKVLTTPNGVPLFVYLGLLVPILIAIALVGVYVKIRNERKTSAHWPTVTGKITASQVDEQIETEEDDHRIRDVTKYVPKLQFSYRVGGRDYFSARRKWGWDAIYSYREQAANQLKAYPVGAAVPVYYNPADPQDSVLEPTSGRGALVPLVCAIIFGAVGIGFMWFFIAVA
jgi:hypothetical protein